MFLFSFPVDERLFNIHHSVDDQFDQAAVVDAAFFGYVVVAEEVPDLAFAIGTWSADIFIYVRADDVLENI